MWIDHHELRHLGFRRLSQHYWQCDAGRGRHGLPSEAYLSLFSHVLVGPRMDWCACHVTFCLGMDRIHFYYHELADGLWEPGGHTSAVEIRRHGREPGLLRAEADAIAGAFLTEAGMRLVARDKARDETPEE